MTSGTSYGGLLKQQQQNLDIFTLRALTEAQRSPSQARAAAPVRALGDLGVLEVGGKIRVLGPVGAAACGPLETATLRAVCVTELKAELKTIQ